MAESVVLSEGSISNMKFEDTPEEWTDEQRNSYVNVCNELAENFGTYIVITLPFENAADKEGNTIMGSIVHGSLSDVVTSLKYFLEHKPEILNALIPGARLVDMCNEFVRMCKY